MTYNFDPEHWFDIERAALDAAYREGRLDKTAYEKAVASLQRKIDAMWDRLDGSYRLPGTPS